MATQRFTRGQFYEEFRGSAKTRANNARSAKTNSGKAAGLALEQALSQVAAAIEESRRIAGNDDIYPTGRRRRVQAQREKVQQVTEATLRNVDGLLELHRQELMDASMPKLAKGEESLARQDAVAFLSAVTPARRAEQMRALARRNDSVAALLTSTWGKSYLEASGYGEEAEQLHHAVRLAALQAAPDSGDQARADAAQAYSDRELGLARNEAAQVLHAALQHIDEIGEVAGHDAQSAEAERWRAVAEQQQAELDHLRGEQQAE